MNILIIEDNSFDSQLLEGLLNKLESDIKVLDKLDSLKGSIEWYKKTSVLPDLIFLDTFLNDNNCIELLKNIDIKCPIIFTTSFNKEIINNFRLNSIDYILKPLDYNEVQDIILKFKEGYYKQNTLELERLVTIFETFEKKYKKRILVKNDTNIDKIEVEEISYFSKDDNNETFLVTKNGDKFYTEYSIEKLESKLNPNGFFKVNLKYIISIESIEDVDYYLNDRIVLNIKPNHKKKVIINRDKVLDFKNWLNKF